MYEYLDRPITQLDRGPQLLVWAMRRWSRGGTANPCAMRDIGTAFHAHRLGCALPHFQLAMTVLDASMREQLTLGSDAVTEHEALLLALIRTLPRCNANHACDIAGRIVHLEAAPHLADALRQLALRLFARDLLCAAPEDRAGGRPRGRGGANDMGNT